MDSDLLKSLFETIREHMPTSASWVPLATLATFLVFGLVLMAKGARFAPFMAALLFMGLGGTGGALVASLLGTPLWVSAGCGGVIGFVAGLVFFRIWLAALVGVCVATAALGLYSVNVLRQPLIDYVNQPVAEVTVPAPSQNTLTVQVADAIAYFSAQVPNFQTSVLAILISTGVAGIVFGLLMPKFSRALWAASTGTLFFLTGTFGLLETISPATSERLVSLGSWNWAILCAIWVCALVYNLYDCRTISPPKTAKADESGAALEPA